MSLYKDKILLITGGTGSFGETILKHFLQTDIGEIRIFSRDEKKQDDMRLKYKNPKINFIIGDTRDFKSISHALINVEFLFQAAALKQVHTCEFYPMQAIETNILGSENVIEAAIQNKVKRTVVLSTDKAVYPINTMGMTKALMEKIAISKARDARLKEIGAKINATRYGNVMCSRGSVIPLFVEQIRSGEDITITNPLMTRFLMSLDESVKLVLKAFEVGNSGDILIQKAPACTIVDLARALLEIFDSKNKIKVMGSRHGEKLHETLCSREEMAKADDIGLFIRIPPDLRDLNYSKYAMETVSNYDNIQDYTSENTIRLTGNALIETLLLQPYIKEQLKK